MEALLLRLRDACVATTTAGAILVVAPQLAGSFGLPKLAFLVVGSLFSLALALGAKESATDLPRRLTIRLLHSPWPAVTVLAIAAAISTATSIDQRVSLLGRYNRYGGLLTLAAMVILLGAISIGGTRRTATGLIFATALATSVAAAYGAAQTFGIEPFGWRPADGTTTFAVFGNSSFAGAAIGIGAVSVITSSMLTRASLRPLWILAIAAMSATAVGARSNGFVLALVAGAVVFAWTARDAVGRWPLRLAVAAFGVVAAIAIIGLAVPTIPGPAGAAGRALHESMAPRAEYWITGIRAFGARPLTGWGPDTFGQVFPRYRSARHAAESGRLTDEIHNVPLERFVESGVLAGLAGLWLVGQGIAAGARPPKRRRDSLLLAGGTGTLAAYAAQSIVSIDVVSLAVFMWVGLGIVECLRRDNGIPDEEPAPGPAQEPDERPRAAPSRRAPKLLIALATATVLAAVAAAGGSYLLFEADVAFARAIRSTGPAIDQRHDYERAMDLNPWEPRYRTAWGEVLAAEVPTSPGLRDEAVSVAESAASLEPGNPYHAARLGMLFASLAGTHPQGSSASRDDLDTAIGWYIRALELDPGDPSIEVKLCEAREALAGQTGGCAGSP